MRKAAAIAGCVGIVCLAFAPAMAADVQNGKKIAAERCARCHHIEAGGAFKQRPPSFQAIAIYRNADDIWGRIIAPSPHAGMPEVIWDIDPDHVQDIVAYITSLDTATGQAP
jgi:mono/diheme cytochrome c family protein